MRSMHRNFFQRTLVATIFGAMVHSGCGSTEKGGDHVPTDKTYAVEALPVGTSSRTIVAAEYDTNVLGRFVHVAERYRLCLEKGAFSEAELTDLQVFLSGKPGAVNQYGLESLINHTFSTLQKFDGNKPRFSQRVALQFVWSDGGACDLVVMRSSQTAFPFNNSDFVGRQRVLFASGQLVTDAGASNAVPVGYVGANGSSDLTIQVQKLTASYLGFAESQTQASYLHPDAKLQTANTWNVVDDGGNIIAGDDSLKIYSFAVAWYEVLKPTDLDRYHYYEDAFAPGPAAVDPLLTLENSAIPPGFQALPGNRYLEGVRKLSGTLNVCFKDDSGLHITTEMVNAWTGFFSSEDPSGIHGQIKGLDSSVALAASVGQTNCQLWIAFRTEAQYPFSSVKANGLYAHEGRVATANNVASSLPVIYVNTSNLSVTTDPALVKGARHVSSVIHHEYAHFLGLRHSSDRSSLHAPAGTGSTWTQGDKALFIEYLKFAK